jgi:hypothetical protein
MGQSAGTKHLAAVAAKQPQTLIFFHIALWVLDAHSDQVLQPAYAMSMKSRRFNPGGRCSCLVDPPAEPGAFSLTVPAVSRGLSV